MVRNLFGVWTLFKKEVRRFLRVYMQTIFSPMITMVLYLLIFAQALQGRVEVFSDVSYQEFLVPGLIMMSIIQNAFANASSSLIQSKVNGSLVFLLLSPLSALEIYLAYVGGAVVRGLMVGFSVALVALIFTDISVMQPFFILLMAILISATLGALGLIGAIICDNYDKIGGFTDFIITPMSYLAGVFYSVQALSPFWQVVSHLNPFFYMVDAFRYGFFMQSDSPVFISVSLTIIFFIMVSALSIHLLHRGYKIRYG